MNLNFGFDSNVFLIQQGVSINIFIKTGKKEKGELANVYFSEVWGSRDEKFDFLNKNDLLSIQFEKVNLTGDNYLFVPRDNALVGNYDNLINLNLRP